MPAQRKPELSIVIPVYQNGLQLAETVSELEAYFSAQHFAYEIICIDDCSPSAIKFPAATKAARIIRLPENVGQQRAIAVGLNAAAAEIIVTTDADLPILPADFMRLVEVLRADARLDLALGARSDYAPRSCIRALGSRAVSLIIRLLFTFQLHDFGCGTNAVRKTLVERYARSNLPASPIKLGMLTLSSGYTEIALPTRRQMQSRSTYTFWRLAALALGIFWFRLRSAAFLPR
jgi:glycosyltransferase involved in cell wall biosynthesis